MIERHLLIDWYNTFSKEYIQKEISGKGLTLSGTVHVKISSENRLKFLSNFYNVPPHKFSADRRAVSPFRLYIIDDLFPSYDIRYTSKGFVSVNINLFDFKSALRCRASVGDCVHATNNIHETYLNLNCLGLLKRYWEDINIKYETLNSVFTGLANQNDFKWIVMRNFKYLPFDFTNKLHGDIDLLVDNFYFAKNILGSHPFKPLMCKEVGGNIVLQKILIGEHIFKFDLRHVGDGYLCKKWQEDMLGNRVWRDNLYIPSDDDYIHSLIYHALIHKKSISPDYLIIFEQLRLPTDPQKLFENLWDYMNTFGYSFVRPEPSVGFFLNN